MTQTLTPTPARDDNIKRRHIDLLNHSNTHAMAGKTVLTANVSGTIDPKDGGKEPEVSCLQFLPKIFDTATMKLKF